VSTIRTTSYLRNKFSNFFHTLLLLGVMILLLAFVGWIIGGSDGLWMLAIFGAVFFLFSPHLSPQFIMRLYRARPLARPEAPLLYDMVMELSERAGLNHVPMLYYVPTSVMNAFSVGTRSRSAIGVTDGLIRNLNQRELFGVLAHEMSHIAHNDLRVMAMADMISRVTHILSLFGQLLLFFNLPMLLLGQVTISWLLIFVLIFAPTISALLQLALSRTREYDADLDAVRITGDPRGLAAALAKMEELQTGFWERIFMPGRRVPHPSILRTHPDTEERIRRLLELEAKPVEKEYHPGFAEQDYLEDVPSSEFSHKPPRWHITGLWY